MFISRCPVTFPSWEGVAEIGGALAGGGKGAAIGTLAGAAAGAGAQGVTRGQQVQIHTETLLDFRLQSPLTVAVTVPPSPSRQKGESE